MLTAAPRRSASSASWLYQDQPITAAPVNTTSQQNTVIQRQ
ncbi:hypothetical protein [Streptomyces graminilatus]|nr:hypothetical protein [Streptomyces graminilatus]